MRGVKFRGGYHDFVLETGGIAVFPRLVAAEHHATFEPARRLDRLGRARPAARRRAGAPAPTPCCSGPSGVGKTTTAVRCMLAALERGETGDLLPVRRGAARRCWRAPPSLGMDLQPAHRQRPPARSRQIDPAELSPGEFASRVRDGGGAATASTFVVIDSLNAYLQAMPGEKYLILQMHELLSYLNQQGVTTLLVLGQHGVIGDVRSDVDLSYLSDGILLFRYFEAKGEVRTALSVVKSRVNAHERTIRECRFSPRRPAGRRGADRLPGRADGPADLRRQGRDAAATRRPGRRMTRARRSTRTASSSWRRAGATPR